MTDEQEVSFQSRGAVVHATIKYKHTVARGWAHEESIVVSAPLVSTASNMLVVETQDGTRCDLYDVLRSASTKTDGIARQEIARRKDLDAQEEGAE